MAVSTTKTGPRRKNTAERTIEAVATGLGNGVARMVESGVVFLVLVTIWVAFGAALVFSQGSLDAAWATICGLPLIMQAVAWLLLLPVMAALWAWETSWPVLFRLTVVLVVAGWSLLIFVPKARTSRT